MQRINSKEHRLKGGRVSVRLSANNHRIWHGEVESVAAKVGGNQGLSKISRSEDKTNLKRRHEYVSSYYHLSNT